MDVMYARCEGLDVHKDTVVACVRLVVDGKVEREVRTFGTTTQDLLALGDWLRERQCTHAAMESTGVYWKPVWHVLEESLTLVLANAMHIRNVPGRKTDVNDATWIADLLAHGLIRGSFVPPTPVQEMRDLTRTRKQLVREAAQHSQRLQKTLEDANIKLASLVSDILGKSGRAILDALVGGESDPEKLADMTSGRLKATRKELVEALRGRVRPHHRFLLKLHLGQIDALDEAVREVEARLGDALQPFRDLEGLLKTMPGVSVTTAQVLLSEIGTDMSRFPTAGTWSLGQVCARATMRALANGARRACARGVSGSKPPSCRAPGQRRARRSRTSRASFTASRRVGGTRRPSSPLPHRC